MRTAAQTTTQKKPCGCSGTKTGTKTGTTSAASKSGCGCSSCGCSGCAECSATDASCKTGTREATKLRGNTVSNSCLPPRPRFFRGELVTDLDLGSIVDYHRAQTLLAADVIGGWGVYCGYPLEVDGENCCIKVGAGVAYDAKGRALVNPKTVCISRPTIGDLAKHRDACDPDSPPPRTTLWLAVAYDDCLDAAKPRYSTPCGSSADPGCDFTRIRERARFVWLTEEPPADYWVTGCLSDPCRPSPPPDENCAVTAPDFDTQEPRLDRCTPDIGIRGGVGVAVYERALIDRWNLPRNADVLIRHTEGDIPKCETGPGSIIDVISGVSCEPCGGEAFVLLARVVWDADECDVPRIEVLPLKRRVLSNADLTYLVTWLLERLICGAQLPSGTLEPELPASNTSCVPGEAPCVEDQANTLGKIIAGPTATPQQVKQAVANVLYRRRVENVELKKLYDFDELSEIQSVVLGRKATDEELEALRLRRHQALTKSERERDVKNTLELIYTGRQRLDPKQYNVAADAVDDALAHHGISNILAAPRETREGLLSTLREKVEAFIPTGVLERLGLAEQEMPAAPAEDMALLEEAISRLPGGAEVLETIKSKRRPRRPKKD